MRWAKAAVQLAAGGVGVARPVELRPKATDDGVTLEIHRDDCHGGPLVTIPLDEAQAFLRSMQGAVDEAYRRAKLRHKASLGGLL